MKRAYTTLSTKQVDEDTRTITGIASSISTDRMNDVMEPEGAQFDLPMPLLWQHIHTEPVGWVTRANVSGKKISITAKFAKVADPGRLRDRLEEAWQSVKAGLVRGLSVGFQAEEFSILDDGGLHFLKWEWLELSAVTIPANADAGISQVKRYDKGIQRALSVRAAPYRLPTVERELSSQRREDGGFALRDS